MTVAAKKPDEDEPYPLYNQIPMHEILQNSLYVTLTQYGEVIVTYTGKGADLKPDDYVTHADGIKVLTGSVQEFMESGMREAVVPVVDDSDVKYGGKRLLGFVMIQSLIPRKIFTRRGEIDFDLEEGNGDVHAVRLKVSFIGIRNNMLAVLCMIIIVAIN